MSPMIKKGGVFQQISDIHDFIEKCTVLNSTLAWDIEGHFNPHNCIDIDPETIYINGEDIEDDPLQQDIA
jgi:hypothetical protein